MTLCESARTDAKGLFVKEKAKTKTMWAGVFLPLALFLGGGCTSLNEAFTPGGISGLMTPTTGQRKLSEPQFPPEAAGYAANSAYRTMAASVELNIPDRTVEIAVVCTMNDLLGTRYIPATISGGALVAREFGKVRGANFQEPVGGEAPVAMLSVRLHLAEVMRPTQNGCMEATLRLNVEVAKPDRSEIAYSHDIKAVANAPWTDETLVPDAFYKALFGAIEQFLEDWDRSSGPDTVARWAGENVPGTVPPELHAIEWEAAGRDVQRGRCSIACNGWEGFRAKHWANAQIAVACRTKLGNIEPARLRVVYDEENYDDATGVWTFSFRCFARSEKVLAFDSITGTGTVIGDLGLLKMTPEAAAKVLKDYVLDEMKSHSGIVTSEHRTSEAYVRFDDYRTDKTYNLISIDFHLPR